MWQVRAVPPTMQARVTRAFALEARWRLDEALAAWRAISAARPDYAYGHQAVARVLLNRDDPRAGLEVVAAARARLPGSAALAAMHAHLCNRIGAFEEGLATSRELAERHPGLPLGHEMVARGLRHLRRFDEADVVVRAARPRFPADLGLAVEETVIAEVRGDWPEMLRRAEALRSGFPRAALAHACFGGALKKLMRYAEADAIFAEAMARFPNDANLAVNHAWVADDRGDWQEALRRWTRAQAQFPNDPRVRKGHIESLGRAELQRLDGAADPAVDPAPPAPPPAGEGAAEAMRHGALFARFQGLGSDCEFGFVQRHFGTEPLGLLRWAGIGYDKLLVGLDTDFAGVGGTERTRLGVNPANQEYFTTDTFYGMSMHTFVTRNDAGEDQLYAKMCRRLAFLRDRLLDDLRSGEKVFVFKAADGPFDDAAARVLHRAIRRHGPGRLLIVRVAGEGERPGEVVEIADGLATGLLDRTGFRDQHWIISFNLWLALCTGAEALLAAPPPAHADPSA